MDKTAIINALNNAEKITAEDVINYIPDGDKNKVMEITEKGISDIKGLWLFTTLKYEEGASLLLDSDLTGFELAKLISSVCHYIPNDVCFSLKRDVFGEEPTMIKNLDKELISEITDGRIRTIYLRKE